jgi:hypothetical protein
MTIASNRVVISYEGQPPTCYGCNGTGRQYQDFPSRKKVKPMPYTTPTTSRADMVIQGTSNIVPKWSSTSEDNKDTVQADEQTENTIWTQTAHVTLLKIREPYAKYRRPRPSHNTSRIESDISEEGTERQQNTNTGTTR